MNRNYNPTTTRTRALFATVALVITGGLGAFIDTLAHRLGPDGSVAAQQATVVVARAEVRHPVNLPDPRWSRP